MARLHGFLPRRVPAMSWRDERQRDVANKGRRVRSMRIWDVSPAMLCRAHLLGKHRELHAIWAVLNEEKTGYSRQPETIRRRGKLAALHTRHAALVAEMTRRGYNHASPLDPAQATSSAVQDGFVDSPER